MYALPNWEHYASSRKVAVSILDEVIQLFSTYPNLPAGFWG
jgi:hypothetical protein